MTQKELYTSPEVAVLTLQSEGVVCQSVQSTFISPFENDGEPLIF